MSAARLLRQAQSRGVILATAESCTGGMLAAQITAISGASDIFDRGFVTYSNAAKMQQLGVKAATLKAHGAVSEETAIEMAEGALAHSEADMAIAITGVAGPGASGPKPEGRVSFALAQQGGQTQAETVEFGSLGRDGVRQAAMLHAIAMLEAAIG